MIKLSIVIITFNEQHNIVRCIESIRGVADEIVIVDSFSKDQTIHLSKSMGATVYQNKFEGHIQQKNYALTKANFNYVLSLDADEAIDDQLKEEISRIKSNFIKDGYYLKRLTNYCGYWVRHCGWYPDKKLRLFDRRKGMWSGTNPHDKFVLAQGDKNTGFLEGDILHYSYYTIEEHLQQMEYFAKIAANEMHLKRKTVYWIQLIINPAIHFIKSYFIKLGFLDGWRGLQICSISSYGTFLKYEKYLKSKTKSVN